MNNTQQKTVEDIIDKIIEHVEKDSLGLICTYCHGGGYDHDKREPCKKCKGTGLEGWRHEYLIEQLTTPLTTYEEQVREEERERTVSLIQQLIQQQIDELSVQARKGGYYTFVSQSEVYFLEKVSSAIASSLIK